MLLIISSTILTNRKQEEHLLWMPDYDPGRPARFVSLGPQVTTFLIDAMGMQTESFS